MAKIPTMATASAPPPLSTKPAPGESLEVRIGTTWLVRVGVVMVLTALVFLGSYLYKNIVPHLGPAAKVGLLYLGAGALAGAGAWLERSKEAVRSPRMLNFARVVLAGGLAAVYYVTYAAHWNPSLLVLRSPFLDGVLLVAWTAFMVWLADRRASEVLATFAILLAYYASAVNEIAAFTLFSNLALTVAALYLLRRHLWRVFPYTSLLATFGSYAFWHGYHASLSADAWARGDVVSIDAPGHIGGFWVQSAFLLIYWLLFTWSVFATGADRWSPRRRAGFAAVNNAAFFLLTTWLLLGAYPGSFWKWALGFGVTLCALAEGCRWTRPRLDSETEGTYFLEGIVLVTLGFITYFSGWQLGLVLAAQSVVLLGRAQARAERLPLVGIAGGGGGGVHRRREPARRLEHGRLVAGRRWGGGVAGVQCLVVPAPAGETVLSNRRRSERLVGLRRDAGSRPGLFLPAWSGGVGMDDRADAGAGRGVNPGACADGSRVDRIHVRPARADGAGLRAGLSGGGIRPSFHRR